MYCDYFGFKERPFTIAPNPKYLFMSERHREALAHLMFGVGESGGFILLTGEVGTGKTTVCRCLLEQLPKNTDIAFILNPKLSAKELLQTICDDLGLQYGTDAGEVSIKQLNDVLNIHLLKSHALGRHTILLIDEAQNLAPEVLEQIRLLTNLETNEKKLLQIILIGQPELKSILAKTELRQLSQRITARYHLDPLTLEETSGYISYRIAVAGSDTVIFNRNSVETIHALSQGVPRLINTICDRSLLGAYSRNQKKIDPALVKQAATEVLGEKGPASTANSSNDNPRNIQNLFKKAALLTFLLAIGVVAGQWLPRLFPQPAQTTLITDDSQKSESVKPPQKISVLPQMTTNFESALAELARIWGIEAFTHCDQLVSKNVSCAEHQGSWGQFLNFNRPAILTIISNGERHFLTLKSADGLQANVIKQGRIESLPLTEIQPLWNGEYTLLWKQPDGYIRPVQQGDSGPQVQWLEQQLLGLLSEQSADEVIIPVTMKFDIAMENQLLEFQRLHGLRADGVAGQQTLMMINQLLDSTVPLLSNVYSTTANKENEVIKEGDL